MNENTNTPNDENEDDLVTGNEPENNEDLPDTPIEGDENDIGGENTETTGTDDEKDGESEETGDDEETEEITEVPEPEPPKPDVLTLTLAGISLALAVTVVVLTTMLLRRKKKKMAASSQMQPSGRISVGKLHHLGDRESQQDCFAVSPEELIGSHGVLAVVADGMGGLADGDKVSQCAVTTMLDGFFSASGAPGDILLNLTEQANRKINQLLGPAKIGKSGSTLVAGLIRGGRFHYISVGDSRICLYRDGQLIQLNREHIYLHDLQLQAVNGVGSMQGAAAHPKAAGLTSYLGMGNLKYIDVPAQAVTVRAGDKFILMSDGVYNALSENELCGALSANAQQAADQISALIAGKAYPHQDNYTAVILDC